MGRQEQLPGLKDEEKNNEVKTRVHPRYGKYIDVTIVPMMDIDKKNTGFVSVNEYTANYKYNVKQQLPEKIVEFIEGLKETKRVYKNVFDGDGAPSQVETVVKTPRFTVIRH